jgi:peptide/nickel transport system substrate-binding protein
MQLAVLLQEMFKQVGVKANIDAMEFATFGQRLTDRKFDAALSVLVNDPSPATIRQVWSIAAARAAMGSNYGAYESPVFDALIDSASAALDPAKAKATYRRAYQVIVDDAPAIWLQEPLTFAGAHKRVHPVDLRADMWFANLNEWTIPAAERTARDNIGLASARP